jgi:signal transduction histidine kinase
MAQAHAQTGTAAAGVAIDVKSCLAEIETLLRGSWPSNIDLELHAASDLPPARCSAPGLRNALVHLVHNARDAMPNGGAISIAAVRKTMSHFPTQIELRVIDNGFGMTRETVSCAFDPFFTTKTGGLGGLGLPMVKRFSDEAGGQLEIESRPGMGTTVTLRVPVWSPDIGATAAFGRTPVR